MNDRPWPRNVICLGTDWYSPLESSVRQIIGELRYRGARILWVNPLPVRFPSRKRPDFRKKIVNKARTHTRILSRVESDVTVFSPIYLPVFSPLGMRINKILVGLQIRSVSLLLGMRFPLVVASEFTAWYALGFLRKYPLFLHFADKISAFREVSDQPERRRMLEDMEREMVAAANLTGCSSRMIHSHVLQVAAPAGVESERILYLPHAVNARIFAAAEDLPTPADIADIPHPIAGYYGSLTQTNDKGAFLAAARSLPDWSFVFIGKVTGDYGDLEAQPNVHFLGSKAHADIPRYGSCFDVCFMGWKDHEWITNCSPLKTLEYLLLGKPIVCTSRIPELEEVFPRFVRFAASPEELAGALKEEFAEDTSEKAAARRQAVSRMTWTHYVDTVLGGLTGGKVDPES